MNARRTASWLACCAMMVTATAWAAPKAAPKAAKGAKAAPAPAQEVIPADAKAEAAQTFSTLCFVCHGLTGMGDGPGGAALTPKPANFASPEWQKTAKDDLIEKTILEGGAAVGKSPLMPPNPQLKDKPMVIKALRAMVREFGNKK